MVNMQKIYDDAVKRHTQLNPFIDYVQIYQDGVPYDRVVELINAKLAYYEPRIKGIIGPMPNHQAHHHIDTARVEQYKTSLMVVDELEKLKDYKIKHIPKSEPLAILHELKNGTTKPDYSRGLIIGGIVFTGLMLLLIWRLGKK